MVLRQQSPRSPPASAHAPILLGPDSGRVSRPSWARWFPEHAGLHFPAGLLLGCKASVAKSEVNASRYHSCGLNTLLFGEHV